MIQEIHDEILSDLPKYTIRDRTGNVVTDDADIALKTPVIQEGTPINRALIRNIQGDLYTQDRYNIPEISYGTRVENQTVSGNIFSKTWTEVTEGEKYTASDGSVLTVSGSYTPEDYPTYNPLTGNGTWYSNPSTSSWYKIMLPKAERIETMTIQFRTSDDDNSAFSRAYIEGSNDDSTWASLYTFTSVQTSATTVTLNNRGYYKYYRFRFTLSSNYRTQLYKFYPETYKADVTLTTTFFDIDVPLTSYEIGKKVSLKPSVLRAVIGANESATGVSAINLQEVAYGNGKYVAVGNSVIFVSEDGETWEWTFTAGTTLYSITYGNGIYVAVGAHGYIYISDDAITWTKVASGTGNYLNYVTYGENKFVAVGASGTVLTSEDGTTWTAQTSGATSNLTSVTYGNGKFVVGNVNYIYVSEDGITWTAQANTGVWHCVTYGNGKFVAVGNSGVISTSEDGITWTAQTSGVSSNLAGVTYGKDKFVVVGASGTVLTSEDGTTWTARTSGTSNVLYGVTSGEKKIVVVGDGGTILASEDAVAWGYNKRAVTFNSYTNPRLKIGELDSKVISGTLDANVGYDLEYNGGSWTNMKTFKMVTGSYTGNTTSKNGTQTITLGFKPDLLFVSNETYRYFQVIHGSTIMGANGSEGEFSYSSTRGGCTITSTGFTAANGSSTQPYIGYNYSSTTYKYIAIKF